MRNKEKDAAEKAVKRQNMIETAFRIFSENNIDSVSMPDIAKECGYGIATLYRYFNTKMALVVAVSTWAFGQYSASYRQRLNEIGFKQMTALEEYAAFLDSFLDLYRSHKELLRFNQFFNIYVAGAGAEMEQMEPYLNMIKTIGSGFHSVYEKGKTDGTLRTDISETEMFSSTLHLMLAATTRYAVGLIYLPDEKKSEAELLLLKKMLLREYDGKTK